MKLTIITSYNSVERFAVKNDETVRRNGILNTCLFFVVVPVTERKIFQSKDQNCLWEDKRATVCKFIPLSSKPWVIS